MCRPCTFLSCLPFSQFWGGSSFCFPDTKKAPLISKINRALSSSIISKQGSIIPKITKRCNTCLASLFCSPLSALERKLHNPNKNPFSYSDNLNKISQEAHAIGGSEDGASHYLTVKYSAKI